MENIRIARILLKIAKYLEAEYEYKSDPDHKHKPRGGGWKQTEQGWSRSEKSKYRRKTKPDPITKDIKPEEYGNVNAPIRKAIRKFRETFKIEEVKTQIEEIFKAYDNAPGWQEINDLDNKMDEYRESPEWEELTYEEQVDLEASHREKCNQIAYNITQEYHSSNLKALGVSKERQGKFNVSIHRHKTQELVSKGITAMESLVDKDLIPKAKLSFHLRSLDSEEVDFTGDEVEGRSWFWKPDNGIYLEGTKQQHDISTMAHEMGHFIEYHNPDVKKLCREFLRARTKNDPVKPLNEITNLDYKKTEVGCKDHFSDPYCGKLYSSGDTEILSKGIERLATDPMQFYEQDPEYFCFVLGIVHGKFKNYKKEDYQ